MTRLTRVVLWFALTPSLAGGMIGPSTPARLHTDPILLRRQRAELELRRAGGPRTEVVDQLLRESVGDPDWLYSVADFCKRGLIDCRKYYGSAEQAVRRKGPVSDVSDARLLSVLEREAAIRSLDPSERARLYRRAFERGVVRTGSLELYAGEAAQRALRENLSDLLPVALRAMGRWPQSAQMSAAPFVEISKAMKGADSTAALIFLVRSAAEDEVKALRAPPEERWSADSRAERSRGIARLVLDKLREANPRGLGEELKVVLALYEPVREAYAGGNAIGNVSSRSGRELAAKGAYLGRLGIYIVQAIGDLGDREFERRTLGERTLWDQVREAEDQLVSDGRLKTQERVAQ